MPTLHCCYLLQSISKKSLTYVGYTTDPALRIRQHNGEVVGGARKTSKHRPWKMICYVAGFSCQVAGLQFEWNWHYPNFSKKLKAFGFKGVTSRTSVETQFSILASLLKVDLFEQMKLHLHCVDDSYAELLKTYISIYDIPFTIGPIVNCPLYQLLIKTPTNEQRDNLFWTQSDYKCGHCVLPNASVLGTFAICCPNPECNAIFHPICLSLQSEDNNSDSTMHNLLPSKPVTCPECKDKYDWGVLVRNSFFVSQGGVASRQLAAEAVLDSDTEVEDSECSDMSSVSPKQTLLSKTFTYDMSKGAEVPLLVKNNSTAVNRSLSRPNLAKMDSNLSNYNFASVERTNSSASKPLVQTNSILRYMKPATADTHTKTINNNNLAHESTDVAPTCGLGLVTNLLYSRAAPSIDSVNDVRNNTSASSMTMTQSANTINRSHANPGSALETIEEELPGASQCSSTQARYNYDPHDLPFDSTVNPLVGSQTLNNYDEFDKDGNLLDPYADSPTVDRKSASRPTLPISVKNNTNTNSESIDKAYEMLNRLQALTQPQVEESWFIDD